MEVAIAGFEREDCGQTWERLAQQKRDSWVVNSGSCRSVGISYESVRHALACTPHTIYRLHYETKDYNKNNTGS